MQSKSIIDEVAAAPAGDLAVERLQRTFDCAPVGIAYVDPTGVLIDVNPAFCKMLGYERSELCGRTFQQVTHPEDLGPNVELLSRLHSGDISGYRMQKRYLRANGEVLWADLTVAVLKDQAERVLSLISIVVDIGETKQLEGRQGFLLRELEHRSKNLLTVVRAAAHRVAATASTVKDMVVGLEDRLTGLAASQDLLVESASGTLLAELVRKQISAFVPANDGRIEAAGPQIELGPNATHTLGMVLHELATNACKYGALSVVEGRVEISWSRTDDAFAMTWRELGGPIVAPPAHKGFGRNVIERSAHTFGGECVLAFPPEGAVWRLRIPPAGLVR